MTPSGLFVGLATLDVVHVVEAGLAPNQKVTALRQDIAGGGPAANAAVTFAALGGKATLLTALGSHPLARVAAHELTSHGVVIVDATPQEIREPAVSLIRVVSDTGERSVSSVNASGAEAAPPSDLDRFVSAADVVVVDGHHPQLALDAAELARTDGVPVVLDAGSWKPILAQLLGLVDVAICSADFADPGRAPVLDNILGHGAASAAVTNGAQPIQWATRADSGTIPVPQVSARDTAGAGDAFHGAAAYALAGRASWPATLEFAAQIAAVRVQHLGPRAWLAAIPQR